MDNVDTDLSIGNILALAQRAAGVDTEKDVTFVTMPYAEAYYPGVSMVLPVVSELVEVLNDGLNPYEDAIQSSDLSVLYRNSDGSYGVTNGTLQDSSLARPQVTQPSEPDDTEEPEEPDETEEPDDQTGTGDSSQSQTGGQSGSQTGDGGQSGQPEDPDQGGEPVLPGGDDSGQTGGGDGAGETGGGSGSGETGGGTPSTDDPGFVDPVLPGDPSDLADIDPSEVFPAA